MAPARPRAQRFRTPNLLRRDIWQEALQFNRGVLMPMRALRQVLGVAVICGLAWYFYGETIALLVMAGSLMGGSVAMTGPSYLRSWLLRRPAPVLAAELAQLAEGVKADDCGGVQR